ncbi:TnsA endonuclease C-terminal domain-containing protein, partial [Pseudomonas aeruginosa]|uniref:TnsA endonuclease C-terminal domain-containing protein n=2 Tax=Pseudomonadota TaxID=1224 RepID=UPI00287F915A
ANIQWLYPAHAEDDIAQDDLAHYQQLFLLEFQRHPDRKLTAMAQRDTSVSDLCKELGIERVTLYRYVGPKGELRDHGKHVLGLT